ncbi:hypothetical protein GCM10022415_30940 [Knoellia locipacati]|uniref:Uncharacterized protein n=1 Tax=Knoellia locipacati TaxID=882824 RepID=A0A512T3W8_9MICO|nr:hypothetical protein KLO01_29490 [Knoellia locipacati]
MAPLGSVEDDEVTGTGRVEAPGGDEVEREAHRPVRPAAETPAPEAPAPEATAPDFLPRRDAASGATAPANVPIGQ